MKPCQGRQLRSAHGLTTTFLAAPDGSCVTDMEEVMRFANTGPLAVLAGLAMACSFTAAQAAPLPTNVATMKAIVADDTVQQVRWGYRGGGWGYRGGLGYRGGGWGYRGLGYRPWRGLAAGAIVGGAIASSAYYGGYGGYYGGGYGGGYYGGGYGGGYYGGGYADGCYPYASSYGYPGYSYRSHYYGW